MAIAWSPSLSVGVDEIDEQHRELFRRADGLLAAVLMEDRDAEVTRLLGFLQAYVTAHFSTEERIMEEVRYPTLPDHRGEHRWFAEELARLAGQHAKTGPSAALAYALDRLLSGWLRDHVAYTDLALGRFLHRTGRGGARVS